jgi:hypothetical protein
MLNTMTKPRELHDIVEYALAVHVCDHGDAVAIVGAAFESVADLVVQRFGVSRFEVELLLRDLKVRTEDAIKIYTLSDPEADAATIVDVILDAETGSTS